MPAGFCRRLVRGYLLCHLSLITIHISDCRQFSDIYISQGSVATYVMCGGIFKYSAATKNILHRTKTHSAVIDRGVNPRLKYAERQLDVVL